MVTSTGHAQALRYAARAASTLLIGLAACKGGGAAATSPNAGSSPAAPTSSAAATDSSAAAAASAAHAAHHWAYAGEQGPEHWGELERAFSRCSTGTEQSPIELGANSKGTHPGAFIVDYREARGTTTIVNNGHTIQVNYEKGSLLSFHGQQYELQQFHLHEPSEHTMGGKAAAAELHLVHKSAGGELAVVGILLREGKENQFLKQFWAELPEVEGERQLTETINVGDALPKNRHYYTYVGSLTTPPCTEGVRWIVMKQSMTISKEQVTRFMNLLGSDARPTQRLNTRAVESY